MVGALCVLGTALALYGLLTLAPGSHTYFHLVWFVLGAGCFALGWAWEALTPAVRLAICLAAACAAVPIVVALAFIARTMSACADPGLDVLVCLGAWVKRDGTPSNVLASRLDTAAAYLAASPATHCVVSGGKGPTEPVSEARAMRDYLVAAGIEGGRITMEDRSQNTRENLAYSRALIPEGATVGIVTSGFHLYRSLRIARRQGIASPAGIAAPSRLLFLPHNLLRESLCLLKDVARGEA